MEITPGPLLKTIDSPADLRQLPREKLHQLCDELRQYIIDVVSVFQKRSEREYDTFGVGHSSTSVSAALGMAMAAKYKGEKDRKVVAVIGDGAMTAGLAFEGLNHAGVADADLLIVLNDNCMG